MGRNASPKKPTPTSRPLSSRLTLLASSSQPSSLTFEKRAASAFQPTTVLVPPLQSTSGEMAPQKRPLDDAAGPSTPASQGVSKNKKRKPRRSGEYVGGKLAQKTKRKNGVADTGDEDLEEGEVVEGNFDDLFMVDTTPAAVKEKDRFVDAPTPLRQTAHGDDEVANPHALSGSEGKEISRAGTGGGEQGVSELTRLGVEEGTERDEAMHIFAREVAMMDEEDEDGTSDEEEEVVNGGGLMLYDNEEELEKAIQGRIVDDSSAPVTGRYYKEADLTKTCVLCGESGHSSRDCTHSQCFICGAIDTDHEARNCPVALVCSACGSRGHFARDCVIAPHSRGSYSQRCSVCSSSNHPTTNCPSHWRIYDTSGPKPPKRKLLLSCANCGSNKDHFVDDCLLPRGHPLKYADPSAFNRAALGSAASAVPGPSAASSSTRRRGGAAGKLDRRLQPQHYDDDDADDDWFASRARSAGGGRSGRDGRSSRGQPPTPLPPTSFRERERGASAAAKGSHIHFSDNSRSRFHNRGTPSSGYHDRDREYGSPYESPREDLRRIYGSGGGGGSGSGNGNGRRGPSVGKANNGGGGSRGGPPTLLDRIGEGGSGRSSRPQPRYNGGYT